MRRAAVLFAGLSAACAVLFAEPAGRPIASVTVPLASVTVPLDAVTVDEAAVRTAVSPAPPSQMQLVEKAQSTALSEAERVATVADIRDQDAFFRLMIKPGGDTNLAVRVAALQSIAEMDVVCFMMEKSPDSRVAEAAKERILSVYGTESNRRTEQCIDTMRSYAKRFGEKR